MQKNHYSENSFEVEIFKVPFSAKLPPIPKCFDENVPELHSNAGIFFFYNTWIFIKTKFQLCDDHICYISNPKGKVRYFHLKNARAVLEFATNIGMC